MAPNEKAYRVVVGQLIAKMRSARALQQKDLAKKIGVAQSTLSRIERGEVAADVWQIRQLARAFSISAGELHDEFEVAFARALQSAKMNTAHADDPWEALLATAGVIGLTALVGFAIAAMIDD